MLSFEIESNIELNDVNDDRFECRRDWRIEAIGTGNHKQNKNCYIELVLTLTIVVLSIVRRTYDRTSCRRCAVDGKACSHHARSCINFQIFDFF